MKKNLDDILEIFFISIIISLTIYLLLYLALPFNLELHIINTICVVITFLSLALLSSHVNFKRYLLLSVVVILIVSEEILFVTAYVNVGFVVNAALLLSLPLMSYFSFNDTRLRRVIEVLALALVSRTILSPFPAGLLNFYSYMPAIYGFLIFAILLYMHFRKISNFEARLTRGNSSIVEQVSVGLAVGSSLGFIEHYILGVKIIASLNFAQLVMTIIFIMLLVGVGEELIFRGLLQTAMEQIFSKWQAIFITSLIFGVLHIGWLNPIEIIFAYSAGMLFGILAYYYDSLISPISAHFIGNVVLFLVPFANV